MILKEEKERKRFIKFALVGALGAVIDFIVMNMLSEWVNLPLVFAGTISFIVAVFNNFTWNRFWTIPNHALAPFLINWVCSF
ncbi:MAG: GtrA family protein [Anaerolineales bacterium]|nr:GtrA family protein [Anaerolineales bacterium]